MGVLVRQSWQVGTDRIFIEEQAMIRSEAEYQEALRPLEQDRTFAATQRDALAASGPSPAEVERAKEPLRSFQAQLEEEVAWHEDVRRRTFPAIRRLTQIGQL